MKSSYNRQVDALYILFLEEPFEVTTHRLSEDIAINYAPDGRIAGSDIAISIAMAIAPNTPERFFRDGGTI